jgi:hypothetical protein
LLFRQSLRELFDVILVAVQTDGDREAAQKHRLVDGDSTKDAIEKLDPLSLFPHRRPLELGKHVQPVSDLLKQPRKMHDGWIGQVRGFGTGHGYRILLSSSVVKCLSSARAEMSKSSRSTPAKKEEMSDPNPCSRG